MRLGRQQLRPDRDRIERERLAGYERSVKPPPVPPQAAMLMLQRQQQRTPIPMPQPKAQPKAQPQQSSGVSAIDAVSQKILKQVDENVQQSTKQLGGLVDNVTLRLGALENTVKSIQHAIASLREEFSGIAQVAGGSVAKKTEDVENYVYKLEKSFVEFSTKIETELKELDRRQGGLREELLGIASTDEDARQLANMAYARSIVVPCRVVAENGIQLTAINNSETPSLFAPVDTPLSLRYPMNKEDDDVVTMLYTHVSCDGNVSEYTVPVQKAGVMTVEFLSDAPIQVA